MEKENILIPIMVDLDHLDELKRILISEEARLLDRLTYNIDTKNNNIDRINICRGIISNLDASLEELMQEAPEDEEAENVEVEKLGFKVPEE